MKILRFITAFLCEYMVYFCYDNLTIKNQRGKAGTADGDHTRGTQL